MADPLETILTAPYQPDVSENALMVLYKLRFVATDPSEPGSIRLPDEIQLRYARLNQVNLSNARMRSADLREAALNEAVLINTDLTSSKFDGAIMVDAIMSNSTADRAGFRACQMERVDCQQASLVEADFASAVIRNAVFNESTLTRANFAEADHMGAVFEGARDLPDLLKPSAPSIPGPNAVLMEVRRFALAFGAKHGLDVDDLASAVFHHLLANGIQISDEGIGIDRAELRKRVAFIGREELARIEHKSAKRLAVGDQVELNDFEPWVWPDYDSQILVRQLLHRVKAVLSDRAYAIVVMTYVEGLTLREVADRMEMDASSVSKQLSRSLALMREHFAPGVARLS